MPTRDDPALWLQAFRLELSSASPLLYGNGRQQTELRLTVQVQPSQPALTPEQLSSLSLVIERPDGTYESLPFGGPGVLGWWQTPERDTRYDLMPASAPAEPLAPAPATFASKLLYVSTTQPGGSNVMLRARIQKDANTVYYTDQADGFDHYVSVTTVRPPTFGEDDYEWKKTHSAGNDDDVFLHEYSLRLRTLGLSSTYRLQTPGMIRWHRNQTGETYATYVGMAVPGNRKIHYNQAIDVGPAFVPSAQTKTPGSESLVLVLNGADNIPYNREGLDHGGPCTVMLVDRHGNDHSVQFRFTDSGTPLERRSNVLVSYPALDTSEL